MEAELLRGFRRIRPPISMQEVLILWRSLIGTVYGL
jgi:hypothetical protein